MGSARSRRGRIVCHHFGTFVVLEQMCQFWDRMLCAKSRFIINEHPYWNPYGSQYRNAWRSVANRRHAKSGISLSQNWQFCRIRTNVPILGQN